MSRTVRELLLVPGFLLVASCFCWPQAAHAQQEGEANTFALRDGDVVGFLGDSITAERTYGKIIEQYTLLRYPIRKVRFLNLGIGGDTAAGGLARLERDVFANDVTVLTVAYGINDIGWGTRADDEHRQLYLESIREIVRQCRARGVRVYICSAAITAEDPETSEQSYLQRMCDEGLAIAAEEGGETIRLQRTMRAIQKRVIEFNQHLPEKDHRTLHHPDGIHLNDFGQLAMAYAILKGLQADRLVSSLELDAAENRTLREERCRVSEVNLTTSGGTFVRLDDALPFNNGPFAGLDYGFVPIPEINQYLIKVTGLEPGRYELVVDGRGVGSYPADLLERGVDIATATTNGFLPGGPWDAQANVIRQLTEARSKLNAANGQRAEYFGEAPWSLEMARHSADIDERFYDLLREMAKPRPYRFTLTKEEVDAE